MKFLEDIFGNNKRTQWSLLAHDVGGDFEENGLFGSCRVRCSHGPWDMILDTYQVLDGRPGQTYTRLRVPFVRRSNLKLKLTRHDSFSFFSKWLGMQDIEVGNPLFDRSFVVRGNDPVKIQALLSSPEIRTAIHAQPNITLEIFNGNGGFWRDLPRHAGMLQFIAFGEVTDISQLEKLLKLFSLLLGSMVSLRLATKDDPDLQLSR